MSTTDIDDAFNLPEEPQIRVTREDVLAALQFSPPREVSTKRGPRLVSEAKPSPEFIALWNAERAVLREQGYSYGECRFGKLRGQMIVTKWEQLPEKIVVERKAAIEMSRATDAEINAPKPDGLEYLGYQRAGIAFGHTRPAVLIGDEMGLGKTIQAIGILNCSPEAKRILIICPASLKLNWKRELEKWQTKPRTIFVADSKLFPSIEGIVIVNYDVLHKHEEILTKTDWDLLVVDEAHYLKNEKARRSKMVFGIKATYKQRQAGIPDVPGIRAKKRVFLTGTPIANRPAELFPLISYLDPISWPDFFRYAVRYCDGHRRQFSATRQGWDFKGASHLDELQDKLRSTIMIRRLKKDVLKELPPKRRQIIELPVTSEAAEAVTMEREAYDNRQDSIAALEAEAELAKADDDPDAYNRAIDKLSKGRSGVFTELSALRLETARAKIPVALEHIRDAAEESAKIVVFVWHKEVAKALLNAFNGTHGRDSSGTKIREMDDSTRSGSRKESSQNRRVQMPVRNNEASRFGNVTSEDVDGLLEVPKKEARQMRNSGIQPVAQCGNQSTERQTTIHDQNRRRENPDLMPTPRNPDSSPNPQEILREQSFFGQDRSQGGLHAEQCLGDKLEGECDQAQRLDRRTRNDCSKFACGDGEAVVVMGDTPLQERQDAVDRFQTDPDCRVFIGSIMAAGVGITLTAASHVIFFELDWVPGNVSQAEDRCHRIGQKDSVLVQHLVLEGSLDAVMARRIVKKQDVIDRALDVQKIAGAATLDSDTAATAATRRDQLAEEAEKMTDDELEAAKEAIRIIASRCDGAHQRDGSGFNGADTMIGRDLGTRPFLSRKQCALARKIVWKYSKQLPEALVARLRKGTDL